MSDQTFENFVVENGNRFAYEAARVVSGSSVKDYSPLYLYGDKGHGKTHLMMALGRAARNNYPEAKVTYISCAELNDELSDCNKATGRDVLMIDDIHLAAGKSRTQESLLRICKRFLDISGRIVISADHPLQELTGISDELMAIFKQGLIADVRRGS